MALKQAGRGHEPGGIDKTSKGEVMVECPACPHPGKNLPDGWENAGPLLYVFVIFVFIFRTHLQTDFCIRSMLPSMPTSSLKARHEISKTLNSCQDGLPMFRRPSTTPILPTTSINERYMSHL